MLEDIKEYNGFDQNWAKSGPLLYAILEIMNAMDRPMVQLLVCQNCIILYFNERKYCEAFH